MCLGRANSHFRAITQFQVQRSLKVVEINYQPTKFILTMKRTRHAMKNYPSFLQSFFSCLIVINKTMTPRGQNIPVKKAFLGKSSPTTILQKNCTAMTAMRYNVNQSMSLILEGVSFEYFSQKPSSPSTYYFPDDAFLTFFQVSTFLTTFDIQLYLSNLYIKNNTY